ncbi:MAG: dTDP-4-amino-4,6-dideoxyglucose formyltransferase [Halopseudomonas sp.]
MLEKSKKILVVSDNSELMVFLKDEVLRQDCADSDFFCYAYSKSNEKPSLMIEVGACEVDVNNPDFIANAKEKYCLIISVHCKQIFPLKLVGSVICVNFHPGLNPYNRGWYPQVFSILNKKPIGATLHIMDGQIDHGDIIDQTEVKAFMMDTSFDLYQRVVDAEKVLIKRNICSLVNLSFRSRKVKNNGNYNSINDFNELCCLDLNSTGTMREHIDIMRALTHADFRNAYFVDEFGDKVYLRLFLEKK